MTNENKKTPQPKAPPPSTTSQMRRVWDRDRTVIIAKDHNPFKKKDK